MQSFHTYIDEVTKQYATGKAKEHSYRGFLETLLNSVLGEAYTVINEPARIECGAPDYIVEKKGVPVGYLEAKDIGRLESLTDTEKKQYARYTESLDNLIYTDYLTFKFIRKGEVLEVIEIATLKDGKIHPIAENFETLKNHLQNFAIYKTQTIKSAEQLAKLMASKARLMKDVFERILFQEENSTLHDQYEAFKDALIHDITYGDFANIYSETLAYGLFTARLHDPSIETFSRQEAYDLIPATNPFLRKLFTYIATDLDDRAKWIVDDLCEIFLATDVHKMITSYNKGTGRKDPFIHFYETFLAKYDPEKRDARGVWYTPESVVSFIVRAVDDVLKEHFDLPMGLADNSKTTIMVDTQTVDKRTKSGYAQVEKEVHKVQVLDVATGTGTFLVEVVNQIYEKFKNKQGMWSSYVDEHLIPRLNGFELLMASYAMCHMKLDLVLSETGYRPKKNNQERFHVYLTNSLEEPQEETDKFRFHKWFSDEVNDASKIKKENPIMVAIGNPPYSVSSSNKGEWIQGLIQDYKVGLNERKINLDDDYIKFIRYAQHFISKNNQGVVAMITNNSYLDGITHRQMRKSLMKDFDSIYILDLHGSAMKKETCPDGSKDDNVFNIMQGVSIILAVKADRKNDMFSEVYHYDLYGKRAEKYSFLDTNNIASLDWEELTPQKPYYFFVPKNMQGYEDFLSGFSLKEVFAIFNSGIKTDRDSLFVDLDKGSLNNRVETLLSADYDNSFKDKYRVVDSSSYRLSDVVAKNTYSSDFIETIQYRPFDFRYIYYDNKVISRPAFKVIKHLLKRDNLTLLCCKQQSSFDFQHVLASKDISDICTLSSQTKETGYIFPLYLYEEMGNETQKRPNLNEEIWAGINKKVKRDTTPEEVFDYIYAVLHAPKYRTIYKEFLKSDFPRIPYPKNEVYFNTLVKHGEHLRKLHLLEHSECTDHTIGYPIDGENTVDKPTFEEGTGGIGRVYINTGQYFDNVPLVAWEFYIGGYQPAQKWLKDRKGKELSFEDIDHYQKIIATLSKTHEVMQAIDEAYNA